MNLPSVFRVSARDQGQHPEIVEAIDDEMVRKLRRNNGDEWKRQHLGVSLLGTTCQRAIWLSFRWCYEPQFTGRELRLFKRGLDEEDRVAKLFESIGVSIVSRQKEVTFNRHHNGGRCYYHIKGHSDFVVSNLNGSADDVLVEVKTHNNRSFKQLLKDGVFYSAHEHYVQMQMYMMGLHLDKALYFAVNKNDDFIHTEYVTHDPELSKTKLDCGRSIIMLQTAPSVLYKTPKKPPCVMCDYKGECHPSGSDERRKVEVNCRTCTHYEIDSDFPNIYCTLRTSDIERETEKVGCGEWCVNESILSIS